MLHFLKSYLHFIWKSSNQHGVHSPFVFDLITKCFYDKTKYPEYKTLKKYRDCLLQNQQTIQVTDFGAGSKIFKSNHRAIAQIAKNAGITEHCARLLFRLVRYFEPKSILEMGTSVGLGTSALGLGNRSANIFSLEGCVETAKVAREQLLAFEFLNVTVKTGAFESSLCAFDLGLTTFDLIYFDGNHQKEATLRYFNLLLQTATNNSIWIFDDIHWSIGMNEAWETIKKNPKVTVTIDTFQWGLVFFRTEQKKQNFTIRC